MKNLKVKNKDKYVECLIDDKDFYWLNQYKWYLSKVGYVCHSHYIEGVRVLWYIHKKILNPPSGLYTDHINRNKLDNRRKNLRTVTVAQNNIHRSCPTRTGFKGLGWHNRNKKWQVYIKKNGKSYYGGSFKDPVDAAKRYNELALEIYGEFAVLNCF